MITLKPAHAIAPALVAASLMIPAPPASAAPAMNGRPDLAAVTQGNVTEVQYRRGYRYHRGNTAAAAGIGFATGALIGAAAANAAAGPRYYYYDAPPYASYGYYDYDPAPSYYYEPAYRGSYGYYGSPGRATNNSAAAQQDHLRHGP